MSTTTSNFGLFKYDTTADAQTAFSITNALNNNWDKLDSNCVRRLSTSAATGSGVRPVYVDASGQVQTINYDLPTTAPLTATTSLSENGYIKFSNSLLLNWGLTGVLGQDVSTSITYSSAFSTEVLFCAIQRRQFTGNYTPSVHSITLTTASIGNTCNSANSTGRLYYLFMGN